MDRYVLLNRHKLEVGDKLGIIRNAEDVNIIDDSNLGAILVEATNKAIDNLAKELPDWIIKKELRYGHPALPRYRVKCPD